MKTLKIYQNEQYRRTATVQVLSVNYDASGTQIITDQTVFFPTGGGQSCDVGQFTLEDGTTFPITDVFEDGEAVVHVTPRAPEDGTDASQPGKASSLTALQPGATVTQEIDWAHRFDNMQRHLGEHILSGAFYRLYGGANKGFHMGDDYITIDIAFTEDAPEGSAAAGSRPDRVTWEMAEAAELEVYRVITADLPVHIDYFGTREEAERYPLRKALAFDEDISVVTVGDPADPADCVACCGTHPSTTGQVGCLKIFKIEPNKGMSRIYFECGERAFRIMQARFNTLYDISGRLSAGYDELLDKYEAQQAHTEALRAELSRFRTKAMHADAAQIKASSEQVFYFDDYSVDDLFNLGKLLEKDLHGLIVLVNRPANTAILLSDGSAPCGALVKEHAAAFGGKGGGKPTSARAFFRDAEALGQFLEAIL